jgi:hypothetical protein
MNRFFFLALAILLTHLSLTADEELRVLVVVGTAGTDEYDEVFSKNADLWKTAAERGGAAFTRIEKEKGGSTPVEQIEKTIAEVEEPSLWIVLIGHGSFDSRAVKFNLHGPDFTDDELAKWVDSYEGELTVINTASSSGSFVRKLSREQRVIITATKNEAEVFYTRFGGYFAEAVGGLTDADVDNDEQVSLLEGFIYASEKVASFYENKGRLATEHAILDDNGDKLGSRAEWYEGVTATQTPSKEAAPDGELAMQRVLVRSELEKILSPEQRARRNELERSVKALRRKKGEMEEDAYYEKLERLLIELAEIYEAVKSS